jgi:hypothetical protein
MGNSTDGMDGMGPPTFRKNGETWGTGDRTIVVRFPKNL